MASFFVMSVPSAAAPVDILTQRNIRLVKGDIKELNVEAIVNAALEGIGNECETGKAVITTEGNLGKNVIQVVIPNHGNQPPEESARLLASPYRRVLEVAQGNGVKSLAFPCIPDEFEFPAQEAAKIAVGTVRGYLDANPEAFDEVIFCCLRQEDVDIYRGLLEQSLYTVTSTGDQQSLSAEEIHALESSYYETELKIYR